MKESKQLFLADKTQFISDSRRIHKNVETVKSDVGVSRQIV